MIDWLVSDEFHTILLIFAAVGGIAMVVRAAAKSVSYIKKRYYTRLENYYQNKAIWWFRCRFKGIHGYPQRREVISPEGNSYLRGKAYEHISFCIICGRYAYHSRNNAYIYRWELVMWPETHKLWLNWRWKIEKK